MNHSFSDFEDLETWIRFKRLHFLSLGYTKVTMYDLFTYLKKTTWKKGIPKDYYLCVRDIMEVHPNDYFNYVALQATVYNVPDLKDINIEELF